jgi:hypothetical protein
MMNRSAMLRSAVKPYNLDMGMMVAATLAAIMFYMTYTSPVSYVGGDAHLSLLVSQAILTHRTIRLDSYIDVGNVTASDYQLAQYDGHYYYYGPLGTSLLSIPVVWLSNQVGLDMAVAGDDYRLQNFLAAILCSLVLVACYQICRCFLDWPASALITTVTAFGSAFSSTLGTALWSHNCAALTILIALFLLVRRLQDPTKRLNPFLFGFVLFFAYLCRPTSAIFVLSMLALILMLERRLFVRTVIALAIPAFFLMVYSWSVYGLLLPPYYLPERHGILPNQVLEDQYSAIDPVSIGVVLYGLLFSPSRGLFTFSPFFLLALAAIPWRQLRPPQTILLWSVLAWVTLQVLVLSRHRIWWGGHSFGPRLFTDITPAFLIVSAIAWRAISTQWTAWKRRMVAAVYIATGIVGILIHSYTGLFNLSSTDWNGGLMSPDVGYQLEYLFDWRFPQFWIERDSICTRNAEYAGRLLAEERVTIAPYRIGETIDFHEADLNSRIATDPEWFRNVLPRWPLPEKDANAVPLSLVAGSQTTNQLHFSMIKNSELRNPVVLMALFRGWSQPRAESAWSLCNPAVIQFGSVSPPSAEQAMRLDLSLGAGSQQKVEVYLNNSLIGSLRLDPEEDGYHLSFPGSLLHAQEINTLEFISEPPANRSVRISERNRIMFRNLKIVSDGMLPDQ